jgi:tol-pal system protein YbgF
MLHRRALACAMALGLAAMPVRAGLFDDEEARAQIANMRAELRAELDEMAKRVDIASKNQLDFVNQVEMLRADIAKLRGLTEVLVNDLEAAQKRQKDFYVDLDSRLRKIETPAEPKAEANPEAPKANPAAETRDYEAALAFFKNAKYREALAAFQSFVKDYPDSGLATSAHYWAASSLYQLRDYGRAAEAFGLIAGTWPDDAKAPDALLAQANAQMEGGDMKTGRKTLESLVEKYPASNAASTAKSRLKTLPVPKKK